MSSISVQLSKVVEKLCDRSPDLPRKLGLEKIHIINLGLRNMQDIQYKMIVFNDPPIVLIKRSAG